MKYVAIPVFLLLGSLLSFAQTSKEYLACNEKAAAQPELNACADQEASRADAELNKVYADLVSKAASDAKVLAKVKAAERAWIVYRDAYLDAMYPADDKQAEYGSMYPMEAALVRAKLTRQQIAALKDLLEGY